MSAVDPNLLIGGVLTSVPATIAALAAWRSSRSTNKKIQTNHGKRPGEYLEEIHTEVVESRRDLREHIVKDERVWEYLQIPESVLEGGG